MYKLVMILIGAVLLAGCQSDPEPPPANETATIEEAPRETVSERRVVRERSEPREAEVERPTRSLTDPTYHLPQLSGELSSDGYGLDMIIDGSSPEAFLLSLEMVASDTSATQYQQFNSALRYLETYLLGPRNLPEFYQRLDAMTAQEVIEMARQQRQRR